MPSNAEARAMLEDLQSDARQRLANARSQAEKARGDELASATMFAASGRLREADQANAGGKLAAAVRALWAARALCSRNAGGDSACRAAADDQADDHRLNRKASGASPSAQTHRSHSPDLDQPSGH